MGFPLCLARAFCLAFDPRKDLLARQSIASPSGLPFGHRVIHGKPFSGD